MRAHLQEAPNHQFRGLYPATARRKRENLL
jgi:hypothetical protein